MAFIPQSASSVDQSEHFLTVTQLGVPRTIIGYGDDSGIAYEQVTDRAVMNQGIDGKTQVARKRGNMNRIATVTLKATSIGYRSLVEMFEIDQQSSKLSPMTWTHYNNNTGTVVTGQMVFIDEPIDDNSSDNPEVAFRIGILNSVVQRATQNIIP